QTAEQRERRLRALANEAGRELLGHADLDRVAARFLAAAQSRLGGGAVALLVPDETGDLGACAVRGDAFARVARIVLPAHGPLAAMLAGLGRPASCAELECLAETRPELGP